MNKAVFLFVKKKVTLAVMIQIEGKSAMITDVTDSATCYTQVRGGVSCDFPVNVSLSQTDQIQRQLCRSDVVITRDRSEVVSVKITQVRE